MYVLIGVAWLCTAGAVANFSPHRHIETKVHIENTKKDNLET
jgi:hypothetical protein